MKIEIPSFVAGLVIGIVVVGAIFGLLYISLERESNDYQATLERIQTESANTQRELAKATGIIRTITDSYTSLAERLDELDSGSNEAGELIESSLGIIDYLFEFGDSVGRAIEGFGTEAQD
jgi:uncharacterized membrane-anchored protein YhcB (DUF1043 family)